MTGQISFSVSKYEHEILMRLSARASAILWRNGIYYKPHEALMDLTAVHANGTPLRLEDMDAAPEGFDFAHDVLGIRRHLNRTTGRLLNCFLPRFARNEATR